jgi:hypothetical protein
VGVTVYCQLYKYNPANTHLITGTEPGNVGVTVFCRLYKYNPANTHLITGTEPWSGGGADY